MRTERLSTIAALSLLACAEPLPPHAFVPDGAYVDAYRGDTTILVRDTGTPDTGAPDTGMDANVDAPMPDVGMIDAGAPPALHFDGQFVEPVWTSTAGNVMLTNSTATLTPYDGDSLTSLYYARDDDWLYFGFEGSVATGDAVVVYLDTMASPPNGVYLMATGLGDSTNTVNGVLSVPIMGTLEFQPEWGWGTAAMPMVQSTYDPRIGFRRLAAAGLFTPLTTDTTSFCTATACEVAVRLTTIGVATGGAVQLVVRVGRPGASGGWSNQTFPTADSGDPQAIGFTTVHVLPPS